MPDIFDSSKDKKSTEGNEPLDSVITDDKAVLKHRHVDEYSDVLRMETPSSNPLNSFMPKPVSVCFDTQDKLEHILLLLRQHPFTQIKKVLMVIFMIFIPSFISIIGIFSFLPGNFQFGAVILWYLMVFGFAIESFLTWFFSVYIITDERIIDVDFISLIYKDISSAKIDKIEDITAITGGALQSLFNYGTIIIQTAGAKTEIEFENTPQPAKVTRLLNELVLEEEKEKIEGRVR